MPEIPAGMLSILRAPSRRQIINLVKDRLGENPEFDSNERRPAFARHVAMYLMAQNHHSQPSIGRAFKRKHSTTGMHHTTVHYAVNRITKLRTENPELDAALRELEAALRELSPVREEQERRPIANLLPPTVKREDVLRQMMREESEAAARMAVEATLSRLGLSEKAGAA